jgi:hypothetical protein
MRYPLFLVALLLQANDPVPRQAYKALVELARWEEGLYRTIRKLTRTACALCA